MTEITFESYHNSCLHQIVNNDFEGLLKKVEEDIAKDPDVQVYWTMKGYALSELDKKEEALEAFSHALELDESSFSAHSDMALALVNLGRWEDVIKECDTMLELDPTSHGNFLKAIALFELKRDSEAKECLKIEKGLWEGWLEQNPDSPKEQKIDAYNWLINILHSLGEYEKELEYFDKMWELLDTPLTSNAQDYRNAILHMVKESKE
jgi:tetratricopeptide (TPR) repeat protein